MLSKGTVTQTTEVSEGTTKGFEYRSRKRDELKDSEESVRVGKVSRFILNIRPSRR